MKPQDFMEALGGVSQEKLDALAKWQNEKTPITGEAPAKENRMTQTAAEPVSAQKRRGIMKQKTKNKAPMPRLFPWNIGFAAAIAACAVVAVSIGKEVIGQEKQMQVGGNAGTSVSEPISQHEPIEIFNRCTEGITLAMDIPAEGTAQVLHSVEDAEPWITLLLQNAENGGEDGSDYSPALDMLKLEAQYQDYDVIFAAVPYHWLTPDSGITAHNFMGGTITKDGRLTVKAGFERVGEGLRPLVQPEIETFCCCFAVPKGSVPEITDFEFKDTFWECTDPLPDDVLTQGDMGEYLCSLPQHQEYSKMVGEAKYLYWVEDDIQTAEEAQIESVPPEECTEVQPDAETLPDPFSAWYWVSYHGNDIPLEPRTDEKCKATVALIRTAEDGKKYLTENPEQNQIPLHTQLSKEWLETGFDEQQVIDPFSGTAVSIDPENPVQDMLFIGIPAWDMPDNVVRWGYHSGTITPSGKLNLDFSVQTVSETAIKALNTEYDADTNFYFFISVPEGSVPELTDWDITFSTYYTSAEPDAYTAEAPEAVGLDGMNRRNAWLSKQPESASYWNSVLGGKYITPIPEEQPNTVTITDSFISKIGAPLENQPVCAVVDVIDLDCIALTLPVHDPDAAAALSDLHVSADGVLSVTLNEYYEKQGVDLTQDTAWIMWNLYVPHGSLPEIKDMDISRENCEDEDAFLHIAGQLCTVTTE